MCIKILEPCTSANINQISFPSPPPFFNVISLIDFWWCWVFFPAQAFSLVAVLGLHVVTSCCGAQA